MNTKYTIKNFRIFDEKGVTIDIKPITILTGCNSSGKSSIVKSLILLNGFLNELKEDKKKGLPIELTKHCLDFSKKENSILGNFLRVVNRHSDSSHVTLEYNAHSQLLGEDLTVSLEFARENNDELRNGHPFAIRVMDSEGTTIYQSEKWMGGKNKADLCARINIEAIKDRFFAFIYHQHLLVLKKNIKLDTEEGLISKEEYKSAIDNIESYLKEWEKGWGETYAEDVRKWNYGKYNSMLSEEYGNFVSSIDMSYNNGVLCYIPIFEITENKTKTETIEFLKKFKKESDNTGDRFSNMMLDKMLTLYSESNKESLLDYYKDLEKSYLKRYEIHKKEMPGINVETINLYDSWLWHSLEYQLIDPAAPKIYTDEEKLKECSKKVDGFNAKSMVTLLTEICKYVKLDEQYEQYKTEHDMFGWENIKYHSAELMCKYINMILEEVVVEKSLEQIPYVSSSIVEQRRLYPLESANEMSRLLKRYLETKRSFNNMNNKTFEPGQFINKWAQIFGVADRYEIQVDNEGLGATIRRFKGEKDKGTLLAEQGYGVTQLLVLLLRIETAIMDGQLETKIGQSCTIAVEEPEVHLHPKFQSMLADLFVEAHNLYNVDFIVETHSEYLIRKLQTLVGGKKITSDNVSLLYVNRKEDIEEGEDLVRSIGFREDGCLTSKFGTGFFDEADNLVNALLDIKTHAHGNS